MKVTQKSEKNDLDCSGQKDTHTFVTPEPRILESLRFSEKSLKFKSIPFAQLGSCTLTLHLQYIHSNAKSSSVKNISILFEPRTTFHTQYTIHTYKVIARTRLSGLWWGSYHAGPIFLLKVSWVSLSEQIVWTSCCAGMSL